MSEQNEAPDEVVEMEVLASGEGELEVRDISELGISEHDAMTAALLGLLDTVIETHKGIQVFLGRRRIVEGLVEDMAALAAHQKTARIQDDRTSLSMYVQLELAALVTKLEEQVDIYEKSSPKTKRLVASEAREAADSVGLLCRSLRKGLLSVELTGDIVEDDDDECTAEHLDNAFKRLAVAMRRLSKLRSGWAKRTLRKRSPKSVALLQARRQQRIRELDKARLDVEAGRISPMEGAAIQFRKVLLEQPDDGIKEAG